MTKHLLVAVDGGATKTSLSLRTTTGDVLFEKISTGSNYQAIGETRACEVLTDLLHAAAPYCTNPIEVAVFAIAGIDTPKDQTVVKAIVEKSLVRAGLQTRQLIIENDVEATLLGATAGQPGALLIAGTGAIAFAFNGTSIVRCGGWGHRAGDEGSGYWIGQQMLKAIFRHADGRSKQPTQLTKLVLQTLGLASVDELLNWLYAPNYTNAQVAALGSLLAEAVAAQDIAACDIAQKAAEELVLLASAILHKIGYTSGQYTFYLNGGVLEYNDCITDAFYQKIRTHYPDIEWRMCTDKPIEYIVKRAIAVL